MTMLMILAMAMVFMTEVWLVWLPTGLPDGERAHLLAGELIVHQGGILNCTRGILAPRYSAPVTCVLRELIVIICRKIQPAYGGGWGSIPRCINFERREDCCNNSFQLYSITIICVHQFHLKSVYAYEHQAWRMTEDI